MPNTQAIFLALACSFLIACTTATAKSSGAVAALDHKVAAWNQHNLDEVLNAYLQSDTMSFISGNHELLGYKALSEQYHKWYANKENMGKIGYSKLQTIQLGKKNTLCTGHWSLDEPNQPHEEGVFSLVYVDTPKGWKIVREHLSNLKE